MREWNAIAHAVQSSASYGYCPQTAYKPLHKPLEKLYKPYKPLK